MPTDSASRAGAPGLGEAALAKVFGTCFSPGSVKRHITQVSPKKAGTSLIHQLVDYFHVSKAHQSPTTEASGECGFRFRVVGPCGIWRAASYSYILPFSTPNQAAFFEQGVPNRSLHWFENQDRRSSRLF